MKPIYPAAPPADEPVYDVPPIMVERDEAPPNLHDPVPPLPDQLPVSPALQVAPPEPQFQPRRVPAVYPPPVPGELAWWEDDKPDTEPKTWDRYPVLRNPDGSHSSEISITVTEPGLNYGRPTNIPTLWQGKQLTEDEAIDRAIASSIRFRSYDTIEEAVAAAEARSKAGGAAAPQKQDAGQPKPPIEVRDVDRRDQPPSRVMRAVDRQPEGAPFDVTPIGTMARNIEEAAQVGSKLGMRTGRDVPVRGRDYPDQDEVDLARRSDAGHATGDSAFLKGERIKAIERWQLNEMALNPDGTLNWDRADDLLKEVRSRAGNKRTGDLLTAAYVAASRSALATLGFSAPNVVLGVAGPGNNNYVAGYLGFKTSKTGQMYADDRSKSTVLHEGIHKGVDAVLTHPDTPTDIVQWLWQKVPNSDNADYNELLTRYLMISKMGDIESKLGSDRHPQVLAAKREFEQMGDHSARNREMAHRVEQIAAKILHDKKRYGGPR